MNEYKLKETIETLAQLLIDARNIADHYREESIAKTKEIGELQRKLEEVCAKACRNSTCEERLVEA